MCWAFKLAAEWRQTFHTDFVVDIIAYRRYGHNESDQPAFTQPLMYKVIEKHPNVMEIYGKKLLDEGVLTQEEIDEIYQHVQQGLEEGFAASKDYSAKDSDWLSSKWKGFKSPGMPSYCRDAPLMPQSKWRASSTPAWPFRHSRRLAKRCIPFRRALMRTLTSGACSMREGKCSKRTRCACVWSCKPHLKPQPIDWATAEGLAYATLLSEGFAVRLSGQDVERGTFSHRHAVIHDQKTGEEYNFYNNIPRTPFHNNGSIFSYAHLTRQYNAPTRRSRTHSCPSLRA